MITILSILITLLTFIIGFIIFLIIYDHYIYNENESDLTNTPIPVTTVNLEKTLDSSVNDKLKVISSPRKTSITKNKKVNPEEVFIKIPSHKHRKSIDDEKVNRIKTFSKADLIKKAWLQHVKQTNISKKVKSSKSPISPRLSKSLDSPKSPAKNQIKSKLNIKSRLKIKSKFVIKSKLIKKKKSLLEFDDDDDD